eukprot:Awhi_evm1s6541
MTTSNRLKFKLMSGTHELRSELSLRDNGSNLCMCCGMDREESVENLLFECPLYKDVRDEVLLRITNLSKGFRKEWFDGDEMRPIAGLCFYVIMELL